jgi:hypothetical protein
MLELSKSFFKQMLFSGSRSDQLIEGLHANDYTDPQLRDEIREQYLKRWHPDHQAKTPLTHPWLFDPCEPPEDWSYDPYYECWIYFGE